jgi:hypothetical protein
MELKTSTHQNLVSDEELHKLKEVSIMIPLVRNSVSKCWRLLDKLEKLLIGIPDAKP